MAQAWVDVLFLHWPVEPDRMRPLLPAGFELETYDGAAWLTLTPHRIADIRLRGVRSCFAIRELSLRTYVRVGGRPGVWFLRLATDSAAARRLARLLYAVTYECRPIAFRVVPDYVFETADFAARWRPSGAPFTPAAGTLAHALTEHDAMFVAERERRWAVEVEDAPWRLQEVDVELERNEFLPFSVEAAPLAWFSARQEVRLARPTLLV